MIIAFEGTDGSGKATQANLLRKRLEQEGHTVTQYSMPQYKKPSAYFVEQYLAGHYDEKHTNAYATSLFYSLDRYEASIDVRRDVAKGNTVILDRWMASSLAHLGGKIEDSADRRAFWDWLTDLEYGKLQIPRPDVTVVLYVPTDIAQQLLSDRGTAKDIHERDIMHLQNAETAYLELCEEYPKDFALIQCVKDGKLLSMEAVHDLIWDVVQKSAKV